MNGHYGLELLDVFWGMYPPKKTNSKTTLSRGHSLDSILVW